MNARDLHDEWNVKYLGVVNVACACAWARVISHASFAGALAVYIACDSIYLALMPSAVRCPQIVLLHHAVASLLLLHAFLMPQYIEYATLMGTVEFDTWIMTCLRLHRVDVRRSTGLYVLKDVTYVVTRLMLHSYVLYKITVPELLWPQILVCFLLGFDVGMGLKTDGVLRRWGLQCLSIIDRYVIPENIF